MYKKKNKTDKTYDRAYKTVIPHTKGQKLLLDTIENNLITFVSGPAGCGKTTISAAMAIKHFYSQQGDKIIITRPTIEVGMTLGALPGSAKEKIDPYLVPLYNELEYYLPEDKSVRPDIASQLYEGRNIQEYIRYLG